MKNPCYILSPKFEVDECDKSCNVAGSEWETCNFGKLSPERKKTDQARTAKAREIREAVTIIFSDFIDSSLLNGYLNKSKKASITKRIKRILQKQEEQ